MLSLDLLRPGRFSPYFRRRRFVRLEAIVSSIIEERGHARVIDIGGRPEYWLMLSRHLRDRVSIRLVNTEAELRVGLEEVDGLEFESVVGDGCDLSGVADRSFDLAHSNSVIEHVGGLTRMKAFADETRRVGSYYYVQTPYLWFPLEPHYGVPILHWLPNPSRVQGLYRVPMPHNRREKSYLDALVRAEHLQLLDQCLMRNLFPDGQLVKERFALMVKSIIALKAPKSPGDG